jgi:hypothetical protein
MHNADVRMFRRTVLHVDKVALGDFVLLCLLCSMLLSLTLTLLGGKFAPININ